MLTRAARAVLTCRKYPEANWPKEEFVEHGLTRADTPHSPVEAVGCMLVEAKAAKTEDLAEARFGPR